MISFGTLLLFVFSVIGMTHILVDPSVIAKPFRDWLAKVGPKWLNDLFGCYQCCGFWIGLLSGWAIISHNPFVVFFCGCAGSFVSTWGATYLNYLEARSIISLDDDVER